jgi:phosphatidylinositol-3-phosphatase
MKHTILILLLAFMLVSCIPPTLTPTPTPVTTQPTDTATPFPPSTPTSTATSAVTLTPAPAPYVPPFEHIVLILFENKEFGSVIGNPDMPVYNRLAQEYTLLTQFYAVRHPSLPNYIALIGGDTFGITSDCNDCFVNAPSLPDLVEASGRTWKTYQEDMPQPCFLGSKQNYAQKHNPFVYFDPIRLDSGRCPRSVVPFTDLSTDIQAGTLPNYIFISPNLCNDAHDCSLKVADSWLENLLSTLVPALDADGQPYLVVLTFDEGQGNGSCCGLPAQAGGRIPVVLVSPSVKNAFQDDTPYTHYSLLKTIAESWGLDYLGHAADANNVLITAPWK